MKRQKAPLYKNKDKKEHSAKLAFLQNILLDMHSLLLAYSGGLDSAFLLKVAQGVLGERVLAVTANSQIFPSSEINQAKQNAKKLGVRHIVIDTNVLNDENFVANLADRCYHCKKRLFSRLIKLAKQHGFNYVADGSNLDDISDFRPGAKAASEYGVRSPLQEAMLTKEEIRILSKKMKLSTWAKPSSSCLSSRFPYGVKLTKENLSRVGKAEEFLLKFGIRQVRIRTHETVARIEVLREDMPRIFQKEISRKIVEGLKKIGYKYITLDLQGYRTGSMNELVGKKDKNG